MNRKQTLRAIFISVGLVALVVAVVFAVVYWTALEAWLKKLAADAVQYAAELKENSKTWPIPFELVFIGIQIVQVVVFFIPGEVTQISGGYLFGTFWGSIYSLIGIGLGSMAAFGIARLLGQPLVERLFGKDRVQQLELFISSPQAQNAYFLVFALPAMPKDIMCYVAGLSKLTWLNFALISMVARIPALVVSVHIGTAIANHQLMTGLIIGGASIVIFIVFYLLRRRLQALVNRALHRPVRPEPDSSTPTQPPESR